jgi:hypothetical protein
MSAMRSSCSQIASMILKNRAASGVPITSSRLSARPNRPPLSKGRPPASMTLKPNSAP